MDEPEPTLATPIEEIIRRQVKRIVTECHAAGTPVTETLAAFTIKAVVLNPRHACLLEDVREETGGDRLVALCVSRLTAARSPASQLMRMQVFFETSYMSRAEVLADQGRALRERLSPIVEDIVAASAVGATLPELEQLYRRVVALTVLTHGLGEPSDSAVEREATTALRSVFPPAELGNFLALGAAEKRQQLGELADITAGVRLFNRDAGKGGVGIDDLPGLLERALSATRVSLDHELRRCSESTARFNAVLRVHAARQRAAAERRPEPEVNSAGHRLVWETDSDGSAEESVSEQLALLCGEMAAHHRQLEMYLRALLGDVGRVAAQLIQLREALDRLLRRLHKLIDNSPAVPADVVLPVFADVADVWRGFQAETVCLSTVSTLHGQLRAFMRLYETEELVPSTWLHERLREAEVISDAEQFERNRAAAAAEAAAAAAREERERRERAAKKTPRKWQAPEEMNVKEEEEEKTSEEEKAVAQVMPVTKLKNLGAILVQYNRLCPVSLVDGGGQLLVGDGSLGLAYYGGHYFSCSTAEALREFAAAPDVYVAGVDALARRRPELIHLLGLERELTGGAAPAAEPVLLAEVAVQTELHPEVAPADPEYSWNEWHMRRRALLLADLRSRRTRGAQTNRSHIRRDNVTQVYGAREKEMQTMADGCSNVPQPKAFLYGLRGDPDSVKGTVNLTPTIEED